VISATRPPFDHGFVYFVASPSVFQRIDDTEDESSAFQTLSLSAVFESTVQCFDACE
jgi:hypothetical protein